MNNPEKFIRTVILVEEDGVYRRKLARLVRGGGHRALEFQDLSEAAIFMAGHTPDLVVADLDLEDDGGRELYAFARKVERLAHVPFLFLVRGGYPLELVPGIALDPRQVLRKPFSWNTAARWLAFTFARLDAIDRVGLMKPLSGSFSELDPLDMVGALHRYDRSGTLRCVHGPEAEVQFQFQRGHMVLDGSPRQQQQAAEFLLWTEGRYTFEPTPLPFPGDAGPEAARIREDVERVKMLDRKRLNPFPRPGGPWDGLLPPLAVPMAAEVAEAEPFPDPWADDPTVDLVLLDLEEAPEPRPR